MSLTNTQIGIIILVVAVVGYLIYTYKCTEGFARRYRSRPRYTIRPSKEQCKNIVNNPIHSDFSYCKNELKNYCNSYIGRSNDKTYCKQFRSRFI